MTISPAFVYFLVFAVYQASGEVNTTVATCGDVLPDCQSYGKVVCDSLRYQPWARINCAKFCSFCGDNGCVDKLHNCETYGTAACQSPYVPWATKNCARYCGICGTIKVPTHPPLAPSMAGCHDEITDCSSYGQDACKQFETWARQNCASFCGFCTTAIPTIPAYFYTGTFPPGSNGTLNRCFYKGQFYQTNDSWQDGCEFNCTCTDDTRGRYICSSLCYTWTLPSVCHLETPLGKCCAKPVCSANFQIHYPPGYVDHDV